MTLTKTDITLKTDATTEKGREIVAAAHGAHDAHAHHGQAGLVLARPSKAGEFIVQTEHTLDALPALTKSR